MKKKKLLILLLDYTKMQTNALENDNFEEFLKIIQERQIIIDQLNTLGEKITQEEREILVDIAKIDQENQRIFKIKFEETKEILRNVREQKKLHRTYASYEEHMEEGFFYDKRSKGV